MDKIRQLTQGDRIKALYEAHANDAAPNIVPFRGPRTPRVEELIDDIEALLSDPITYHLTEDVLRTALQHIASQIMKAV